MMTPAQQAKEAGLKSLAEVARITREDRQKLHRWATEKPELFRVVLAGCKALADG